MSNFAMRNTVCFAFVKAGCAASLQMECWTPKINLISTVETDLLVGQLEEFAFLLAEFLIRVEIQLMACAFLIQRLLLRTFI